MRIFHPSVTPRIIIIRNGRRQGQVFWRQELRRQDFGRRSQEATKSLCSRRAAGMSRLSRDAPPIVVVAHLVFGAIAPAPDPTTSPKAMQARVCCRPWLSTFSTLNIHSQHRMHRLLTRARAPTSMRNFCDPSASNADALLAGHTHDQTFRQHKAPILEFSSQLSYVVVVPC